MDPRLAIALAVLAIPVGLLVGIFGYLLGSFVLMQFHTERRPVGHLVRDFFRELRAALLTQPLMLFFYVFGRRMGGREGGVPVVFVHGYMQNRVDFWLPSKHFASLGPLYGFNYPWWSRVDDNARRLAAFIEAVREETGAAEVDLVCHSMGGLVAMEHLRLAGAEAHVRRCVTFASPHGGVVWRGPIIGFCASQLRKGSDFLEILGKAAPGVPLLSVYSTHDNVVHPPTTSSLSARGGKDHVLDGGSHLAVLFDRGALQEVVGFLSA